MARRNLFGRPPLEVEEIVLSSDGNSSPEVVGIRTSFAKQIRAEEEKRDALKKKLKELKEKERELVGDSKYLTAKVRLEKRNKKDNRERFYRTVEEKEALEKKMAALQKKNREMDRYKKLYEEQLLAQMTKVLAEAVEKAKDSGEK